MQIIDNGVPVSGLATRTLMRAGINDALGVTGRYRFTTAGTAGYRLPTGSVYRSS